MKEIPGVAERWTSTDDRKVWTFNLRKDAKWTNGRPVTADDFVRSWKRLIVMGKKAAFSGLVNNIARCFGRFRRSHFSIAFGRLRPVVQIRVSDAADPEYAASAARSAAVELEFDRWTNSANRL